MADQTDYVIVGIAGPADFTPGQMKMIGSLTPDLVLPAYLQSLEQRLGYRDVHIARRAISYERVDLKTAEAERSTYPDQHRHMTKTTWSCQR